MQNNSPSVSAINPFTKTYRFIISKIDRFINNLTMYRLTLYGLTAIFAYSLFLALTGFMDFSFSALSLIGSLATLIVSCYGSNLFFSKLFKAPINIESSYLTAFILFFIMPPIGTFSFVNRYESFAILALSGVLAMASKYIFAIHKKHIFNPAAIGAFLTGLIFANGQATWWIGSLALIVPTAILGFLIVRKIHRARLFFSFIFTSVITLIIVSILNDTLISSVSSGVTTTADGGAGLTNLTAIPLFLKQLLFSWPLVFFATIMLTEPLTTPPTKKLQGWYGAIVGVLFGIPLHLGSIYMTPQLALIIGNLYTYIVSPKQRLVLTLKKRVEVASNIFHFSFSSTSPLKFKAGQYIEWTLPHEHPDSRGNRRYFTVASSPTENEVAIGVKIMPDKSSSFKHELLNLKEVNSDNTIDDNQAATNNQKSSNHQNSIIVASQVSGDFILPNNLSTPLVFIAGGIGITPFRSMIKYLLDTNQKRDIILFYACMSDKEFAYTDIFTEAERVGVKFVPVITTKENVPSTWSAGPLVGKPWQGVSGYINKEVIENYVPNYIGRTYFLSGPGAMVDSYKHLLLSIGVSEKNIKTDYFPGF